MINMRLTHLAASVILCSVASVGHTEVGAKASRLDGRVQNVLYQPDNIIRVSVAEGVVTTIELPAKDVVKNFAMGDRQAWHAKFDGNLLVLKPSGIKPDTNLTVFTERRNYLFTLQSTTRKSHNVAYWLRVKDPADDEATPEGMKAARERAAKQKVSDDLRKARYEGQTNWDYWISGAAELQPKSMNDNGRHTFLTFNAANAIPAIFVIEPDGTESIVDFHVESDTVVIHQVARRFILRRGSQVAGITNKSPATVAQQSPTGTISDKVIRNVKSENQP